MMFDQVFDNLQKATESSAKIQQEMLQTWFEGLPNAASKLPESADVFSVWRKQWEQTAVDMLQRQKTLVDKNYEAGIKALAEIFASAEAKNPQEYQQKVTDLYRKSFDAIRQLSESQVSEFKAAAEKYASELAKSPA